MQRILIILVLGLFLAACATQPAVRAYDPPGFFMGLVHGIVALPALVGSIFMDVRVYAFPNSGGWYDFGYMLGIMVTVGGASSAK